MIRIEIGHAIAVVCVCFCNLYARYKRKKEICVCDSSACTLSYGWKYYREQPIFIYQLIKLERKTFTVLDIALNLVNQFQTQQHLTVHSLFMSVCIYRTLFFAKSFLGERKTVYTYTRFSTLQIPKMKFLTHLCLAWSKVVTYTHQKYVHFMEFYYIWRHSLSSKEIWLYVDPFLQIDIKIAWVTWKKCTEFS